MTTPYISEDDFGEDITEDEYGEAEWDAEEYFRNAMNKDD
jgi:hypothetical protein